VKKQREAAESFARIRGSVRLDVPSESDIVVVLGRASVDPNEIDPTTGRRAGNIIDHFPLERAGTFVFAVSPGTFRLAAFADENGNLSYDPGEPALVGQPDFTLAPGENRDGIELVILHDVSLDERYDILELQARAPKDQANFSLGRFTARGKVVDLDGIANHLTGIVTELQTRRGFKEMVVVAHSMGGLGPSGDGVLSVKSETRIEAVAAAESILPLDYNHVDIVHSPEAVERLNLILENHFEKGWRLGGN
jgi:hypothetical protein